MDSTSDVYIVAFSFSIYCLKDVDSLEVINYQDVITTQIAKVSLPFLLSIRYVANIPLQLTASFLKFENGTLIFQIFEIS